MVYSTYKAGLVKVPNVMYTSKAINSLVNKLLLISNEKVNFRVYRKFWQTEKDASGVAPYLIVYADLMATDDPRCQEAAKIVYEKYLRHLFKGDEVN